MKVTVNEVRVLSPQSIVVCVNNALVWVEYPERVSRDQIIQFLDRYYIDHPARFRAFETLFVSWHEITQYVRELVREPPQIEIRSRRSRLPNGAARELPDGVSHGTYQAYRFHCCRCNECVAYRRESDRIRYQKMRGKI